MADQRYRVDHVKFDRHVSEAAMHIMALCYLTGWVPKSEDVWAVDFKFSLEGSVVHEMLGDQPGNLV